MAYIYHVRAQQPKPGWRGLRFRNRYNGFGCMMAYADPNATALRWAKLYLLNDLKALQVTHTPGEFLVVAEQGADLSVFENLFSQSVHVYRYNLNSDWEITPEGNYVAFKNVHFESAYPVILKSCLVGIKLTIRHRRDDEIFRAHRKATKEYDSDSGELIYHDHKGDSDSLEDRPRKQQHHSTKSHGNISRSNRSEPKYDYLIETPADRESDQSNVDDEDNRGNRLSEPDANKSRPVYDRKPKHGRHDRHDRGQHGSQRNENRNRSYEAREPKQPVEAKTNITPPVTSPATGSQLAELFAKYGKAK